MVDSMSTRMVSSAGLVNPYMPVQQAAPSRASAEPRDVAVLSTESPAQAPEAPRHFGRFAGAAVALGLSLLGAASPAAAQVLQTAPQTSVSQTVTPAQAQPPARATPTQSTFNPSLSLSPGTLTPPSDTIPPSPLPAPRPSNEDPWHMYTGAKDHFSFGTRTQQSRDEKYTYGQFELGRTITVDLERGPWHSETTLDASAQGRLGWRQDPGVDSAGNLTGGLTLGENLSRDMGSGFSAYGRASIGIQGGFGTRFEEDEPLNAMRMEGALGLQHSNGLTTLYAEGFGEHVKDLGGSLGHDRVGLRVGAQHLVSEKDVLQVELNTSQYSYTDGRDMGAYGGDVSWLHRTGRVWWGPSVGVEHRENGDNRINAGIAIKF